MVDNRIHVPASSATCIGTVAQYTVTGCTKFMLCSLLCKMSDIALVFGLNLPLLFKLHRIWSVDSR